jgi:hypothetical protein
MHFEYEITADEYVASQILVNQLGGARTRIQSVAIWILAGIFLIFVAWNEGAIKWATILLAAIGAWWIYAGVASLFPARHFRRAYRGAEVAGKRFIADVDEDGFEVKGESCCWRVQWAGVLRKGEDAQVFMLYSQGTVFMFGKKYLSIEQQQELRRLSGLAPTSV